MFLHILPDFRGVIMQAWALLQMSWVMYTALFHPLDSTLYGNVIVSPTRSEDTMDSSSLSSAPSSVSAEISC